MKTLHLLSLTLIVSCGGSHVIGKDRCISGSCAVNETCDFDGTCRMMCGPNYPGSTCGSGTVCAGWICRTECTPAACPAGSQCEGAQTTAGITYACGPVGCRDTSFCQAGEACSNGFCAQTGYACGSDGACGGDQWCDQGTCRVRCGANYPRSTCAAGTTCSPNALCL